MFGLRQLEEVAAMLVPGAGAVTLVKAVTACEALALDDVCMPPGFSIGREAENERLTGCPSPGIFPNSGSEARLISGETE